MSGKLSFDLRIRMRNCDILLKMKFQIKDVGMSDPLHGITLKVILERLVEHYGWEELGERISIRCFIFDPSMGSSLAFLRRTPWARTKVESLYLKLPDVKKKAKDE